MYLFKEIINETFRFEGSVFDTGCKAILQYLTKIKQYKIYIYIYTHTHTYIYIERERETESAGINFWTICVYTHIHISVRVMIVTFHWFLSFNPCNIRAFFRLIFRRVDYSWPFEHELTKLRLATIIFVMFVCPCVRIKQLGSHPANFYELYISVFFENPSRKFKFH